jgi:hypothetical protein
VCDREQASTPSSQAQGSCRPAGGDRDREHAQAAAVIVSCPSVRCTWTCRRREPGRRWLAAGWCLMRAAHAVARRSCGLWEATARNENDGLRTTSKSPDRNDTHGPAGPCGVVASWATSGNLGSLFRFLNYFKYGNIE